MRIHYIKRAALSLCAAMSLGLSATSQVSQSVTNAQNAQAEPLTPPYSETFADESFLESYTIIDSNQDGTKWEPYFGKVQISYNSELAMDDWLITPALVMQKEMVLNFDFEYRYLAGDVFTLMISTDFNGDPSSISSATWVDVTPDNLDKTNDKSFTSYSVDLASYIGQTIYVGFRYIGDNATGLTTTCQIDNVYVGIPK